MAFAMVISLMPMALAEDPEQSDGNDNKETFDNSGWSITDANHQHEKADNPTTVTGATCTKPKTTVYSCKVANCNATLTVTEGETAPHDYSGDAIAITAGDGAGKQHSIRCKNCDSVKTENHTYKNGKCKVCGADEPVAELSVSISKKSPTGSSYSIGSISATFSVTADVKNADNNTTEYKWELSGRNVGTNWTNRTDRDLCTVYADALSSGREYTLTCTVSAQKGSDTKEATASWTISLAADSLGTIKVTVDADNRGYYLDDEDDEGGDSVIEQIEYAIDKNGKDYIDKIWFDDDTATAGTLDVTAGKPYTRSQARSIEFVPKKAGTASFGFGVLTEYGESYSGTLSITVKNGTSTSGDIEYTATAGKDVTFDAKSFDDFWTDEYSSGILDYVTFSTSSSNGTLYDEDGSKLSSSSKCYYDPSSSRQIDLDGVYFEPKSSKAGTVKISFTAYGLNKKNGTDKELSGTVVITYLNGDIDDITYKPGANGKVDLVAKDFTDVFKAATGSSASSLTITFTSLPDNGTLTYGSRDTKVTKSTTFKTSGSGNKISDVTYTASGSKSDTITYTAASGSTKITGKIIFNPTPANISLQVPYTCTSANGVTFSTADFTSRASALTNNHTIAFGQPSNGNGGLYYTGIGTKIDAGIRIPVSTLNTVTYRPAANGSTSITCIIYDATGTIVGSGTISITVTGVTTTPTNPTNPTTPGTTTPTVNDFRDVAADAWYRNDLSRLVNLGVVSGVTSSKFEPLGELNYGAALKLICKAVDVTQPEASGAQWAINYKNYAVQQGWITSDVDLTATIYRTEVAQIAAKALNLSPSSAKPFADSNDPYVAAMNAAGIIRGNDSGLFKGESSLRRSEICAIVCRMLDYRANSFNNEKPGWL